MRIVQVIAPGPAGGAESAVRSLATGLRDAGHIVEVVALTSDHVGEHPFVDGLRRADIPVTEFRGGRRDYLREARDLATLLVQRNADLVHTHVYHADTVGFMAASPLGLTHVSTLHGFTGGGGLKQAAYVKVDDWVLKRCAAVICVAPNVLQRAIDNGIAAHRAHLIPNGYDPAQTLTRAAAHDALQLRPGVKAIGWIGRLSREKGADLFLDALAVNGAPAVDVVIIGDGPERAELERRAANLVLSPDRVRFVGQIPDAGRLVTAFDVLALSSRTEGTPMVLLEAMASRVPIVTFGVGGVNAMLSPESALVVAPGDVRGLARALTFAITCPHIGVKRAEAARRLFERNHSAAMCARLVAGVYADAITPARFGSMAGAGPGGYSQRPHRVASTYRRVEM